MDMKNINVYRYKNRDLRKYWLGYIEPEDMSWILFIDADGRGCFFPHRDPKTGSVVERTVGL